MSDTNDDTNHYNGVLLEDMNSKLDAILEGQAAMADVLGSSKTMLAV